MIETPWVECILIALIFPLLVGMYASINKRVNKKTNKEMCDERSSNINKRLDSHDKLLNMIYSKVEETNINVAGIAAKIAK